MALKLNELIVTNAINGGVTGNAATATILQTARNIGGVSFNGSADINLPGVNTAGNQNTSGNAATATALTSMNISQFTNNSGYLTSVTNISGNAATSTTASYANALNAANRYTVGGITGSNFGTSSWATNATTATVLQTARTIGGVSFDGSVNINLPGVNTAGNQNTSGNAATATSATSATFLNSSNYINRCGSSGNANTDFQNTPAGSVRHNGDDSSLINSPGGTWWFYDNYRHSNNSNYWGIQVAWGWEDQANKLATRNITGGTFGSWVYYLNSSNAPYANNMNQYVRTTDSPTFSTVTATLNGNAGSVTYLPGRTDAAAYPVLWGAAYTNGSGTIAYSCAAVTIQSSTGTLNATSFSGAGTGLTGTAAGLSIGGSAASLINVNSYTVGNLTVNGTAQMTGVRETYTTVNISTGVVTIDLTTGTVFRVNYNATISSFAINNITAGKVSAFTIITIPAAGAGGITFAFTGTNASNPKWAGGSTPMATTTAGKYDVFSFIYDGNNWFGFTGGLNY